MHFILVAALLMLLVWTVLPQTSRDWNLVQMEDDLK